MDDEANPLIFLFLVLNKLTEEFYTTLERKNMCNLQLKDALTVQNVITLSTTN